jgi:hypothetical protein
MLPNPSEAEAACRDRDSVGESGEAWESPPCELAAAMGTWTAWVTISTSEGVRVEDVIAMSEASRTAGM